MNGGILVNSIRMSRRIALAVMLALGSATAVPTGLVTATGEPADAVLDWNVNATTAIVTVAKQPPASAILSYAMVQGAVYDAVNAIDRGHQPYLVAPAATGSESKTAAAAQAAHDVLVALFPDQTATLDGQLTTSLRRGSRWHREGRRPGDRPRHRRGDDHGTDERRPVRPVDRRAGHHARRVAPGAARSSRATRRAGSGMSGRSSCHAATCSARTARTP